MSLRDVLFPKRCLGCQTIGDFLCNDCQRLLQPVEDLVCPACGRLSVGGLVHPGCRRKWGLDGIIGLWEYRGLTARVVQEIKYRLVRDLVGEIGSLADSQLKGQAAKRYLDFWRFMGQEPIVVPVPLHRSRLHWRGFNQAEAIGKRLAQAWQVPLGARLLERTKATQPQVELKGEARRNNVKGVFQLHHRLNQVKNVLKGKRLLLIDDVWTTGSTMRECGKVLKRAGADQVWGLTLAQ